jgi:dihydroorotate dehydrogenase/Pyruvate/2-oxoacid:ferredoxin oxidoreductase delta subunit
MTDFRVSMGNLKISNPIIISAGHFTRIGKDIEKCDGYGAGAIITKSSFLESEYEKIVKPCEPGLYPCSRAQFHNTGDGFLNSCGLSPIPVEGWAAWFKDKSREMRTPVIASIMAITPEGYVKSATMLQDAGAKGIEILLACPLPHLLPYPYVGGASFNPAIVEEVTSAVRKAIDIPLGVKLMFNPLDPSPLKIPKKVGLDWITACLALLGAPGIDLDTGEPQMPTSVFLSGSSAAKYMNFVAFLMMQDQYKDIHISATGGTRGWQDVVEYVMYGAGSVQIHTLFMEKGLQQVEKLKKDIVTYMDSKKYHTIDEMKGTILNKLIGYNDALATYGLTKGKIFVTVDKDKCTGCGVCESLCNWDALTLATESIEVLEEKCEGCGLCVNSCPEHALRLENVQLIRQIARSL